MSIAKSSALVLLFVFAVAGSLGDAHALGADGAKEKQRFVIMYYPGPKWIKDKSIWEQPLQEHGNYMHSLFSKKILVMGGPFIDSSGGLVIIDVENEDQAHKIVDDDPAVKSQIFAAAIHPWLPVD